MSDPAEFARLLSHRDLPNLGAIAILLAGALIFAIKALCARRRERLDRRLDLLSTEGARDASGAALAVLRIDLEKLENDPSEMREGVGRRGRISALFQRPQLHRELARAGLDPKRVLRPFKILRLVLCGASGITAALLLEQQMPGAAVSLEGALVILAAAAAAGLAPGALLRARIRRRQRRIEAAVPDMIDLMILCIEAGLTLEAAMARAVDGLAPFAPDAAAEMRITLNELRILPDKSRALDNLEKRTASRSLKYLVLSLRQSERYGTSVSGALKAVAVEMRKITLLELENAAARMPALLSVPLILLILPPVVALAAGPGFVLMMRAIGG